MNRHIKIMAAVGLLSLVSVSFLLAEEAAIPTDQAAAPVKKTTTKKKKHKSAKKTDATAVSPTQTGAAPTAKAVTETKAPAPSSQSASQMSSLDSWLKKMKDRLNKTQTKNNKLVAVAAVRGTETKEAPPLYWKGLTTEGEVKDNELKEFQAAVEAASKGSKEEAKNKFQAFVTAYPKSPLVDDAQQGIALLNESPTKAN